MKKINYYFSVLFSLFFLFACGEESSFEPIDNSVSTFGIRHDKTLSEYEAVAASDDIDLPNFTAVVSFSYSLDGSDNEDFVASGTLIDPEWILTAAHNFYDADEQDSPAPIEGITVKIGDDPNNPDLTYSVSEIVLHPSWLSGSQDYEHANDLCLVKLSSPITEITPVEMYTMNNEEIGAKIWFCGFGDYSDMEGQNPDLDSKKHAIENTLDRKNNGLTSFDGTTTYSGGLLAFDFDDPEGIINSLGDNIINKDEEVLGSGTSANTATSYEGTTVKGDSGGPLFILNGNEWEVAGVLSGGADLVFDNHTDGDYGDISIFTRVSTAIEWIELVIR